MVIVQETNIQFHKSKQDLIIAIFIYIFISQFSKEKVFLVWNILFVYIRLCIYVFAFAFTFVFVIVMAKRLRPGHMPGLALLSQICILDWNPSLHLSIKHTRISYCYFWKDKLCASSPASLVVSQASALNRKKLTL